MKAFNLSAVSTASAKNFFSDMWESFKNAFVPDMGQLRKFFKKANDFVLFMAISGYSLVLVVVAGLILKNLIEKQELSLPEPLSTMWSDLCAVAPQLENPVVVIVAAALFIIALRPAVTFLVKGSTTALERGNNVAYEEMIEEAKRMMDAVPGFINFLAWKVFLIAGGTALVWFVWNHMG